MNNLTSTKASKQPKLGQDEMSATIANANRYETILEIALPFLALEDLFPNVCVVNNKTHRQCWKLLQDHCQEHHPTLILMEQVHRDRNSNVNNDEGDSGSDGDGSDETSSGDTGSKASSKANWLTYKRFRYFLKEDECTPRPIEPDNLNNYEVVLQIFTAPSDDSEEAKPLLLAHGTQTLQADEFAFYVDLTCPNKDTRLTDDIVELALRVRVLMRRKSTGGIVIIMNTTDVCEGSVSAGETRLVYRSDYLASEDLLSEDFFPAEVSFTRHMTSGGDIGFGRLSSDGPVKAHMWFPGGPEYADFRLFLNAAINAWQWF